MDILKGVADAVYGHPKTSLATFIGIATGVGSTIYYRSRELQQPIESTEPVKPNRQQNEAFIHQSRDTILCRCPQQSAPSLGEMLISRAGPNDSLRQVFGIDNAFTTVDEARWSQCKKESMQRIQHCNWREIVEMVESAAKAEVEPILQSSDVSDEINLNLSSMLQRVTFKVMLKMLFHCDPSQMAESDVNQATQAINDLCIELEEASLAEKSSFSKNTKLHKALQNLIPDCNPNDIRQNPLNMLLPAYEPMWRAALLGLLECKIDTYDGPLPGPENENLGPAKAALKSILENPDQEDKGNLGLGSNNPRREQDENFTAFDIAREVLRLYPSINKIFRQFPVQGGPTNGSSRPKYVVRYADIESLHRLQQGVWEDAAAEPEPIHYAQHFCPQRWLQPRSANLMRAYSPFGHGKFECPAASDFANRTLAILIGAFAKYLCSFYIQCYDDHGHDIRPVHLEPLSFERLNPQTLTFLAGVPLGVGLTFASQRLMHMLRSRRNDIKRPGTYFLIEADTNEALINNARDLINSKTPLTPQPTPEETTKARGLSNKGIGAAFGIHNSFTTTDEDWRLRFTTSAKNLLRTVKYSELIAIGKKALQGRLADEENKQQSANEPSTEVDLASIVSDVTFRVSMKTVFPHLDPLAFRFEDVEFITEGINNLWLSSKGSQSGCETIDANNKQLKLNSVLKSLMPSADFSDPKTTPMGLIIPSYEAIWRVVLFGYLSCQHHVFYPDEETQIREQVFEPCFRHLQEFLNYPVEEEDNIEREPTQRYVPTFPKDGLNIAKEALRLYPSTKTIYRHITFSEDLPPAEFRIPISRLHQLKQGVWHDPHLTDASGKVIDVKQFWPARFVPSLSPLQEKAYLPFATGRVYCPSKEAFGEHIVALMIAVLADGLQGYRITATDGCLHKSEVLESGRGTLHRFKVTIPKSTEKTESA
ncbi:MAG: hypothetical protein Q9159_006753 [Coniocarpon cinnabarinum]